MTPQRLELQEHLEWDVLLACAATRSQGRRRDVDEDTAAATARLWWSEPKSQKHRGPQGEKESGWRLWWYASSFMPPRSPAGASHSIHHEVNNRSLCDLIHHDARELAMRRPSVSTLLWRFAARSPRTNPRKRNPSGCRQLAISYTVHTKIRQNVLDQSTDTTSSKNCQG